MAGDVPYSSVMEVPLRAIRALKLLNLTRNKQLLHEVQNTVAGYQTMCCVVTNSLHFSARLRPIWPLTRPIWQQESCAIAKMTARCALYMGALKIFGTPWLRPRQLFPTFSWAFVPIDHMNVPTKFELRSFTHSWDNRGYPKNLGSPWIRPRSLFSKNFYWAFIRIGPINIRAKFEVRSFTRSWDNRGYSIWTVPGYAHAPLPPKF